MNRYFADTFYFLALLNKYDEAHSAALKYSQVVDRLVTTEWILIELADAVASSPRRDMFVQARQKLYGNSDAVVIPLSMALQEQGIELYTDRPDKEWSLTDCISFVVMQREGLTEALTGDHRFEQAGFIALLK